MDVLTFKIMGFDFTVELRQNVAINLDILTHMNINLEIDKTIKCYVSFNTGLDIITILTIRYKIVRINHDGFRHRNKTGIRNQYDWSHRDFELL